MNTIKSSRRNALKLLVAGSVASLGTACGLTGSLPRGRSASRTDGKQLSNDVRDALFNNPSTSGMILTISSEGDEVVIKGQVDSSADISNVDIIANQVAGVRHAVLDLYVRD